MNVRRVATGQEAAQQINAFNVPGAPSYSPRLSKLTEEERRALMKEGKCFRCRLQGHRSKDCPLNQQSNNFTSQSQGRAIRTVSTTVPPSIPIASTSTTPTRDSIKDISDMYNKMKMLEGEEKEQAVAYLKDLVGKSDF